MERSQYPSATDKHIQQWNKVTLQNEITSTTIQTPQPQWSRLAAVNTKWMCCAHLLGFGRVGLCVDFEERKLLTVVVIHPFTEVVADVEPSAERSNNDSGVTFYSLPSLCFFCVRDFNSDSEPVWPLWAIFHLFYWTVLTCGALRRCFV